MNLRADLCIAGGSLGGCAAALAAARNGLNVVLISESEWVGGQLTAQGVPPDEHGWIEDFGCTASYRALRNGIRNHYRSHYPLTATSRANPWLNPGNGWVSPLCHEPRVAHQVLRAMLEPHIAAGRLRVLCEARPVHVDVDGDRVRAVEFDCRGQRVTVVADWFADATELGDLLPLAGVEFTTGAEAQSQSGEPHAPAVAAPANVQAFSWCFAMEHYEGRNFVGPRPERYEYWRNFVPTVTPAWPGPLLSWTTCNPRTMQPNHYRFDPHHELPRVFSGLWSYRRLLDRSLFEPGAFASDISLVNWPQIDYLGGDLCSAAEDERQRLLAEARQLSLCVFHWMQTEAPRPDGGCGWPGLRLCGEVLGTADGLAQEPYIRESRRIQAVKTIVEQDVSAACRPDATLAAPQPDSVGIGYYRIDLHPSTGGDNYIDVAALPFQIPLGALLPVRMRNLLPACKNIGTTHITNGCYRLHPVEWNIGEAVGLLAAFCQQHRSEPHAVANRIAEFQAILLKQGVELSWPDNLDLEHGDPHRHAH